MHVYDFLWGGNSTFKLDVINKLIFTFQIGKEECGIFKLLVYKLSKKMIVLQWINSPILTVFGRFLSRKPGQQENMILSIRRNFIA